MEVGLVSTPVFLRGEGDLCGRRGERPREWVLVPGEQTGDPRFGQESDV